MIDELLAKKREKANNILFLACVLLLILDQATKLYIKGFNLFGIQHQGMMEGDSFSVIGDFFRITFVENPGMAFSINFGEGKFLLSLFSIVASIALVFYLKKLKHTHFFVQLGFTLILAGAAGNLIDRVFYGVFYGYAGIFWGKVVDFLDFDFFKFSFFGRTYDRWPVFNIADSCVTTGIITLLIFNNKIPTFKELFGKKEIEPDIKGNDEQTIIDDGK